MESRRNQSIQREIEQGLRKPTGEFIGDPNSPGLHVLDYIQGWQDFEGRSPWPDNPTPSYELGRHRASLEAEAKQDIIAAMDKRHKDVMDYIASLKPPTGA